MKVLVTDGCNRAALAITRSLGKAGFDVFVGSEELPCLASASKYCRKSFLYPSPYDDPRLFSKRIRELTESEKPDVLLPVSESTTLMIMAEKENLEEFCSIPFSSYNSVNRAASKYEVIELARKLDIPTPETVFLESPHDDDALSRFNETRNFPVVLKPSRSRTMDMAGWRFAEVKYATDYSELETIIDHFAPETYPILLQERIYGPGVGIFVCFNQGEMIAAFSHERIREKPPSGGVSVLRESVPVNPLLKTQSEKLLKELGWRGVAMVEFKKDNRAGDYKLMEINGRFWGSLQLAIDAGVDFPLLSTKVALGENIQPVESYKIGVKTRWFWGDLDALLSLLIKSADQLKLPEGFPGRLKYFYDFCKFWGKDLNYEILKKDDIKPWFLETRRRFLGK